MKYVPALFCSLALLLAAGCTLIGSEGEAPASIVIELDKSSYYVEEPARLTVRNFSGYRLKLSPCGRQPGSDVEKRVERAWVQPYVLYCPGIGEPVYLDSGETFRTTMPLPILAHALDEVEGTYRLKLWACQFEPDDESACSPLPDDLRTTPAFEIVTQR